jgi:hypothetical protein
MITVNREMEVIPGKVAMATAQLAERGFHVEQVADSPLEWSRDDVVWLLGNAAWFPRVCKSIERLPRERRPALVVWHVEPLPMPAAAGMRWPPPTVRELAKIALRDRRASDVYTNYWTLRRLRRAGLPDALVTISAERQAFLRERGIDAAFVPEGSEASDGRDLGLERDIDVLHLGVLHVRRRKTLLAKLRKAGIDVDARCSYVDPDLWGEGRTRLINRAQIMLSVARFPGTFSSKRFLMSMACNSLVVSDWLFDPSPYVPGEHFVQAPIDEIPAVVARYLSDDAERRRIAQQGHELVMNELTQERTFSRFVDAVAQRLA